MDYYNITNNRDRAAYEKAQALLQSLNSTADDDAGDAPAPAESAGSSAPTQDDPDTSTAPDTAATAAETSTPSWSAGMIPSDVDFTEDAFTEGILVPVTQEPSTWRTTDTDSTTPPEPSANAAPDAGQSVPHDPSSHQAQAPDTQPPDPDSDSASEHEQQPGWTPNTAGPYSQPAPPGYPYPPQQQTPSGPFENSPLRRARRDRTPPLPQGAPHPGQQPGRPIDSYLPDPGYPQWVHDLQPKLSQQHQRPAATGNYTAPEYPPQQHYPTHQTPHQQNQQGYYPYPTPPAPAPSAPPTPDTTPRDDTDDTPVSGWRTLARRLGLRVKESPDEQLWHTMVRTINRPLREPKVIGVTAPKGGVAKTTVLSMVAVVAARLRPACRIVAVDTDHNGGLALRAEGRQPSNILEFAKAIQRGDSDRPNFMAHTIDGVDILGSSPSLVDPPVTPEMWQVVLDELKNRYDLIFVDMSIMQATETYAAVLQSLDGLIIVATPTVEATRPLGEIPRWLDLNKAPHLKSRRTTVFTKIDTEPDEVDVVKMIKYEHDSGIEAAAVPFDPHLRAVTNLAFDEVDTATKKAFVTVAASAIKNVS